MENGIFDKELVLINKLEYGPRWPQRPIDIPIFNFLVLFSPFSRWYIHTEWDYIRWPRISSINRGDILVFDSPINKGKRLVKRCIGLPGDTIEIRRDSVFINEERYIEPRSVQHAYYLSAKCEDLIPSWIRTKKKFQPDQPKRNYFKVNLNRYESELLKEKLGRNCLMRYYKIDLNNNEKRHSLEKVFVPRNKQFISKENILNYKNIFS